MVDFRSRCFVLILMNMTVGLVILDLYVRMYELCSVQDVFFYFDVSTLHALLTSVSPQPDCISYILHCVVYTSSTLARIPRFLVRWFQHYLFL